MMKILMIFCLLWPISSFAHDINRAPELWSWFKKLHKSAEACLIQSGFELEQLGIKNLVSNKYGQYGVYRNNRIVVKCIEQGRSSLLMVAVAGHDRDSAEYLRNIIIKKIN